MMPFRPLFLIACISLFPLLAGAQSDSYALQRILQRYTEAYGGFRDADSLSSISVEGIIEQNGQSFDFLMRKKRPYSMRYRLSNELCNVISGYNGDVAWMRTETNGEVSIQTLDAKGTRALRAQARFDSPLFRAMEKSENEITLLERATLDERSVYVLSVDESGRGLSHYYIDVFTAYVVRVDQLDANGEVQLQTLYRDYKEVDGYPFAHEVETRLDGQTLSLAKVNEIVVNPGLLSFYFEQPRR
ncbi:hypothetical protein SH580_02070 [Coraliomargarita algicola]|uniref:Outer membrane lipoprotein-sorting protein n=1 Tax=Coraliomargarita algicola TaxID=3092156 RepID=A0ABZ0RN23_9BACT|nr:hypothetical protein [Coraliomargarita sp. J2-16]WPJ96488.1 hypothetical protein SH580_02070 [Coraliomargarita sp. J2-16]